MKSLVAVLMLMSSSALAQVQQFSVNPHDPNTPAGATGPAVQYTQRIEGTIIAIGSPLYQNIHVGQTCLEVPAPAEPHRPLNRGTVTGATVGLVVGAALGDGSALITAATGAAGGAIGNRINRNRNERENQFVTQCQAVFEKRIVGWTYTATTYEGIQVQGVMARQPQVGSAVTVIVVQKFYAGE